MLHAQAAYTILTFLSDFYESIWLVSKLCHETCTRNDTRSAWHPVLKSAVVVTMEQLPGSWMPACSFGSQTTAAQHTTHSKIHESIKMNSGAIRSIHLSICYAWVSVLRQQPQQHSNVSASSKTFLTRSSCCLAP